MPAPLHLTIGPHAATLAGLNPLDWAIVIVLGVSTVMAFLRGLIRSLISLAGVVLGIVLAAWYAPAFAVVLIRWVPQAAAAQILAFLLIVAATYLAAVLLGRILRGAAQAVGLGLLDRLGGAAFGLARAVVILAAALLPAAPLLPLLPYARNSVLLPYLQSAAHGVSFVMPQDFGTRLLAGAGGHASSRAGAVRRSNATERRFEGDTQ